MDPENNLSRVERTLWTVWYYISEAVSRFIRPQPADIVNNDPDSNQESAADPHSDSTDGDTCSGGVDEEQPVARPSLLSSSRPVVTWEGCNTELRSDEESMQHKTKPRKGSESKEDGESMREEQHGQTENDHSNDLRAKEDKQETMDMEKLDTYAGLATPENEERERGDSGPRNLIEVVISEERTEGETGAEETVRSVTSDDHPAETQVKEENDQMHDKEEPDLEAEHTEVAEEDDITHSEEEREVKNTEEKVCIITNLSPEEEDHIHEVEAQLQKNDAVTLDEHPGKDEIIKQTPLKDEDDQMQHEEEQNLKVETTEIKVCITTDISPVLDGHMQEAREAEAQKNSAVTLDDHPREDETIRENEEEDKTHHEEEQDFKAEVTEAKVRIITSLCPDDYMQEKESEVQQNDALTLDGHPREDETIKETEEKEENDQMQHEEEQDLEAENTEAKVFTITSLSPEDDHIHEGDAEAQKKDAVTLDDHPREDKVIKESQLKEEDDQMHYEDEQTLETETTEEKLCRITSLSSEEEDHRHKVEAELQKNDAVTLDDHPREDETIEETQLKEEDHQMQREAEQDLEAETTEIAEEDDQMHHEEERDLEVEDTEVKVCRITSLSPEEEDHMQKTESEVQQNDAVTLDDHPREDETIKETEEKEENDQMQHEEEQDLEAENTEVKVCRTTSLSPEEEDHRHEGDAEAQKNDAVKLDDHVRQDKVIEETQLKEEDDQMHHEEEQDLEAETAEVAEEDNETLHEDKQNLEAENTEEKVCRTTSLSPEDDHIHEGDAEAQKKDAVTLDDHPSEDETIKENEEDDKTHHEDEQDLEAETTEEKLCRITSLSSEEEDHRDKAEAELQKNDAVTLEDHPSEDETIKENEEDNETHHEEERDLEAENTEVKVCRTTSLSSEEEDHTHEGDAEPQKNDAVTLEDHPREDETIKETQEDDQMQREAEQDLEAETFEIAEEDDQIHHEEERDLEVEDTKVKVWRITSLSPEDDYRQEKQSEVQQTDAVTLDDHPREDETIKETKLKEEDDQMQREAVQDLEAETTEIAEEHDQMHHEEEQDLEAENTEVKVWRITSLSPEEEDHRHEGDAEAQKNDAVTLEDHPREDEILKESQLKEEDDQMQHEEEQDLEAETSEIAEEDDQMHHEEERDLEVEDTEVKVCITTSLSPDNDYMQETEVQQNDAVTLDDHPREDETIKETEEKDEDDQMHHEEEQDLKAEFCDVMLQLASENVKKSDEITNQTLFGELPDASVDKPILVRQYPVTAHRSENEEGEKETEGETEQHAATEKENIDEAAANKTIEVPELDKDIRTVAEESEGENVLTECDACSKEAAQESIKQLHTAEFTDEEKEDMRVQAVHTKTGQTGVTIADISVDERLVDQDQEKELIISREAYTEECSKEVVHSSASVTVKPEGETVQETSEEFKNIPLEISEGQFTMLQELNTPTCEEIQEGVSKYNNELWGVDENTTQRFLEAGDCEEIPATQLPEEVESTERESLQNTGCSTGADYLLLKESMEEKQESKEETETSFDLVGEEHSEILDLAREAEKALVEGVFQESGHSLGKEEGNLLADSMKIEVTEAHFGLADETERSGGLHDGTKGSFFSKEANATGGDCETKEAIAATEVVRFVIQESVQAINLVQSISGPSSLQEDMSESGFMRHSVETEPKSVDDSIVEMQDKAITREEGGHGDEEEEEEEADDGIQSTKEMENLHLWVTETAGELIVEVSPLNEESELSQDSEPQEIKNQSPDRACEISETQITETETADESTSKDLPVMSSKVKSSSTSGHQDVIDEEILDLWIETAMSEDTDGIKEEELESGQLLDTETDTSNEERGDLSLQKELLAESVSGESEVVSDTEMASSTVESGFLGQSFSDSGIQSSEAQPLKSTSTGSLHWIHDMVVSMSADIPGVAARPQPQSETQDVLMEESAEPEKESITDTGVHLPEGRHLDQESQEKAGEERVERVETESGSQKAYEDVGEAVKKVEAEEERLDSLDEPKPTDLEQPESDSQGETRTESEKNTLNLSSLDGPQPGQSEALAETSLPGLNKAEVAEEPAVKSENETEVDSPALDFAMQRSRIAVKNRRVRPPKNPRSLLHMPSAEPTPTPIPTLSSRLPVKVPGGVPLGGMGIGIKLPGFGAGLPVLKKRQPAVRKENSQEAVSQEPKTKPEETSEQDETPKKPKWMPPKHPGFGNPLMAELKTKLKKTPKE